jgi:hypothetical protein
MATGNVDADWAISHRSVWYEEQMRDLERELGVGSIVSIRPTSAIEQVP